MAGVRKRECEVASFERKLRNESQLNRKVGLRRNLKAKQHKLIGLIC